MTAPASLPLPTEVKPSANVARAQAQFTPYQRGYASGIAGQPGPAFPTSQSSWAERLFNRGWLAGVAEREARAALAKEGMKP